MAELNRKVFELSELEEGRSKSSYDDGEAVFAVKKDGQVFIYRNQCPHLGSPLDWLEDQFLDGDGELIQCASHGALFTIDGGRCVAGPCLGQALSSVEFIERDEAIFIAA